MKLQFSLEYSTSWGQDVRVQVTLQRRKGADITQVFPLQTQDGVHWAGEALITERDITSFVYRYVIMQGDLIYRQEWNGVERNFPASEGKSYDLKDYWKDIPLLQHLYSSAYLHCISHTLVQKPELLLFSRTIIFRVQAPQLRQGECLALIGSLPQLGQWLPERAIVMQRGGAHEWCLSLDAVGLQQYFEYKYVVLSEKTGELIRWEEGGNRQYHPGSADVQVVWDKRVNLAEEHWKAAGLVIPVFSLRSEHSQGIGDFGDLKRMVDWLRTMGLNVLQLLPIYDTMQSHTWQDCYPYNAISIYALHPLYVDLSQCSAILDGDYMTRYERERVRLAGLRDMDYEAVEHLKMDYLRRLYAQEGDAVLVSAAFMSFFKNNSDWLVDYAVFCHLRDTQGTSCFTDWSFLSVYDEKEVHLYADRNAHDIGFYYFVQYLLSQQLAIATRYARRHSVILKGDIPIGISRTSVEAWAQPELFNMDGSAGAPPDDFSADGQNWGFPTYNWTRMQQDGYKWWTRRFQKMAEYFDAYRIDHVLGFFRIWQIPTHSVHGLLGQFMPSLPMTVEEIENYGFRFRKEFFTTPYINDWTLSQLLDTDEAAFIKQNCLVQKGPDWYSLQNSCKTQVQVRAMFEQGKITQKQRDALYTLISDVLFIEDVEQKGKYHPRISVQKDFVYRQLSGHEREAFDRLYEDYYFHRHNDFWGAEAMKKLPALVDATQMLVCAEDLGMVPACVPGVMDSLRILSLEIQSMPKAFVRFGRLEENPYRSVATIFTHDMPTLRQWWEEDYERAQAYWKEMLQKDGDAPATLPGWLAEEIISRHLFSSSMLCLISFQDWLSMSENLRNPDVAAERINIPANPRHYWRYRMHMTIEQLMGERDFNKKVYELVKRTGR